MLLLQYISHYISCISYYYYTSHMLTPKFEAKKTWLFSLFYYAVTMAMIDLFFHSSLLKPFLGLINILGNCLIFLQGRFLDKLKYSISTVAISIIGEIIYVLFSLVLFNRFYVMDTPLEFIRTSIVCNLVIFLLFYIVSHKQINALFTTPNVSIILIFYFFITSFVISNLYDRDYQNCTFGHSPSYHSMVQIFTKVSSVIIPILIFLIIRELIKMEKKIMEETMYQEIHHEYEKHLTALYSQDRMDAYIRHDLINYIETYQRMNRNE